MSDNTPTTPDSATAAGPTTPDPTSTVTPGSPSTRPTSGDNPLRGSRTSGLWAAVVALGILLVLLIIFIAQNTQTVQVTFLGWDGSAPLSVTLLIATAAGLFLATAAGSLRILQLRRRVKRDKKA
ncbi:DUF1049 domain-containing protein [Nocardioides sp. KIGAM211]|uniref:DUF1049 domain-containing protein n=1 Tax=Nocardioides luti TaxID=2761101 RepID=A0A7X0RDJ3_9ACTN|nr:lipopolysaccharide assembly protein LapA domain-containing protein [Nocardioides luti]MBB6626245.1 DUF1049 domain-containing protein [Nocardioides luti]